MSQSYELKGIIHSVGETTEYGVNGFTKREFVVKLTGDNENPTYPNHIALELIKDKCVLMDNYHVGDEINVSFNLSGRLWSGGDKGEKCFTSLQAWRVTRGRGSEFSEPSYAERDSPPPFDDDQYEDIPF